MRAVMETTEAADYFSLHERMVAELVETGKIPHRKVAKQLLWLFSGTSTPGSTRCQEERKTSARPRPAFNTWDGCGAKSKPNRADLTATDHPRLGTCTAGVISCTSR
jgi:hypothetical protein